MKAYVTTHGLYNSGSLYGAWISLPIDEDGRAAIERIKDADRPVWAEPYFDYESYGEAELSGYCHYQDGTTHVLCY